MTYIISVGEGVKHSGWVMIQGRSKCRGSTRQWGSDEGLNPSAAACTTSQGYSCPPLANVTNSKDLKNKQGGGSCQDVWHTVGAQ